MEINNNEMTNINTVEKIDILGMDLESLQEKFIEIGMKKFNASQVFDWLHNKLVFGLRHIKFRKMGILRNFCLS